MTPGKLVFEIEFKAQCWWASCPQLPGLLATGGTIPEALENAATGIRDLALAFAHAAADGLEPKPIFRDGLPHEPAKDSS